MLYRNSFAGPNPSANQLAQQKLQNDHMASMAQAYSAPNAAAQQAGGMRDAALYQHPARFAEQMANAYGFYTGGLGSAAQAMGNERSAMYGANAMAEAARQGAASNIGSAALGAYGGIGNSALAAWAANQGAYNKAASDMHTANQMGMSQYGQSRNAALGQLGQSYADAGGRLAGASAIGNLNFSTGDGGGGGFSATGAGGSIASGSYGGGGGGGLSGGGGVGGISEQTFAGLGGVKDSLMSQDITRLMDRRADLGMMQLDNQHYSSRGMPSQMMNQALGGLIQLGNQAYATSGKGMNQFYATQNRAGDQFMGAMTGNGTGVLDRLKSGYQNTSGEIRGLWNDSLGRLDQFRTPLQRAQDAEEVRLFGRGVIQRMASEREADASESQEAYARRVAAERAANPAMYDRIDRWVANGYRNF